MIALRTAEEPFKVEVWFRETLAADQYPMALSFAPGKWQIGHLGRDYDNNRDVRLWEQSHVHKQEVLSFLQHHGLTWSGEAAADTSPERWRLVLKALKAAR